MNQEVVVMTIGIVGLIVTLLLHTGALFYWGGRISTSVKYHEERIKRLDDGLEQLRNLFLERTRPGG